MEHPGRRTTVAPAVAPTHSAITSSALSTLHAHHPWQPFPSPSQFSPICLECGCPEGREQVCCTPDTTFQTGQGPTPPQGVFPSTPKWRQHYVPCLKKGDRIPSLGNLKGQTGGTELWLSMFLCQLFFQTCGDFCDCPLNSVHLDSRLLVLSHHAS